MILGYSPTGVTPLATGSVLYRVLGGRLSVAGRNTASSSRSASIAGGLYAAVEFLARATTGSTLTGIMSYSVRVGASSSAALVLYSRLSVAAALSAVGSRSSALAGGILSTAGYRGAIVAPVATALLGRLVAAGAFVASAGGACPWPER